MKKNRNGAKIMWKIALIIGILIIGIIIFFKIPYSRTKSEFSNVIEQTILNTTGKSTEAAELFSEKDIANLPLPVQKYFKYCGFMGTPKMSYMKATFKDIDFKMSADRTVKIDYTQYNFAGKPERFALIDSSLYGIPFEGLDSYRDGAGSMRGVLAKVIPLFDQRGESMDKASLVTFLAECLIFPDAAIKDYIKWEEIDDTHVKATITYYGISAEGVFTFDENGAVTSFKTKDRVATNMDGSTRQAEWSALYSGYQIVDGIRQPKVLKSVWHYPEGDNIYFNENESKVGIEYK
jgi:hypothetical protein